MTSFWEDPATVARFAARKPDHRLIKLMESLNPSQLSVLDIGCAAGRNTVYLAELGASVYAIDSSNAMLQKTQERLTPFLSQTDIQKQIKLGSMDDLSDFKTESFDLLLALGVYQDAKSQTMWQASLKECTRVLKQGGLCLVANFAPDSEPQGRAVEKIGEHQYQGFANEQRIMTLMNQEDLDSSFASFGLYPLEQTYSVKTTFDLGFRTTVNALYKKA